MMHSQPTLPELEMTSTRSSRLTQRQRYFKRLNELCPFDAIEKLVRPHYFLSGQRGRQPYPLATMIRVYILQISYNLSDPATEDLLSENWVAREFVGLDWGAPTPDETTILHFRHLIEKHQLGEKIFGLINAVLQKQGLLIKRGVVIDATFIDSPRSTKNKDQKRDPEMGQGRKGLVWHQGMKAHIAVDIDTGLVTKVIAGPASEHDLTRAHDVLSGDEKVVYGDSGYLGIEKREEIKAQDSFKDTDWQIGQRPSSLRKKANGDETQHKLLRQIEHEKSSIRCKVEWIFKRMKLDFGFNKTRYRGIEKNLNRIMSIFALANLLTADCYQQRIKAKLSLQ